MNDIDILTEYLKSASDEEKEKLLEVILSFRENG